MESEGLFCASLIVLPNTINMYVTETASAASLPQYIMECLKPVNRNTPIAIVVKSISG